MDSSPYSVSIAVGSSAQPNGNMWDLERYGSNMFRVEKGEESVEASLACLATIYIPAGVPYPKVVVLRVVDGDGAALVTLQQKVRDGGFIYTRWGQEILPFFIRFEAKPDEFEIRLSLDGDGQSLTMWPFTVFPPE